MAVETKQGYNGSAMELILQSVNYNSCPVGRREKVALSNEQAQELMRALLDKDGVMEVAVLQTCNRTEFYLYARKDTDWRKPVIELMGQLNAEAGPTWKKYCKQKRGIDVAGHLFRVAAGLDSQMLGENQILSQVKAAYIESIGCRASRFIFHRLFHTAFRVGKAVRTQTDINCGAVSISLAAVEMAKEKIKIGKAVAMVIGAGENAELAARYLVKGGLKQLIIANRNRDNAIEMCGRLGKGCVIGLDEIPESLDKADLIIASTGATQPVVNLEDVKTKLSKRKKPLLIIDIAVPRDIDERISKFGCVTIVNIDDLDKRIAVNREKRSTEIPKAEKIVDDFTKQFANWRDSLHVVPVVAQLTQRAIEVARAEAKRYAKNFGAGNAGKLEKFAESLAMKLLHGPVSFIKNADGDDPTTQQLRAIDMVNKMFLLDEEQPK